VDEGHGEETPVLSTEVDGELVEQQPRLQFSLAPQQDEQADDARDGQQAIGHDRLGHTLRARAAEGPLGGAVVAQLLAQPADAGLQLRLLRRRGTTCRLAVGPGGTGHVVGAHAGGRQGLPGAPRERILGRLRGRDPGLQGSRLLVEAVAAFGQP